MGSSESGTLSAQPEHGVAKEVLHPIAGYGQLDGTQWSDQQFRGLQVGSVLVAGGE